MSNRKPGERLQTPVSL